MSLIKRRHIPTKIYQNQLMSDTCSSSSSSSASDTSDSNTLTDKLSVHTDPNHPVIIIRHRPKYFKTNVNTVASQDQFDLNMVPVWIFLGSMAGVLVLAIMFLFAWRAHRRRLSKIANKRLHLDGADRPLPEGDYKPVDNKAKEDNIGEFNSA